MSASSFPHSTFGQPPMTSFGMQQPQQMSASGAFVQPYGVGHMPQTPPRANPFQQQQQFTQTSQGPLLYTQGQQLQQQQHQATAADMPSQMRSSYMPGQYDHPWSQLGQSQYPQSNMLSLRVPTTFSPSIINKQPPHVQSMQPATTALQKVPSLASNPPTSGPQLSQQLPGRSLPAEPSAIAQPQQQ
ncbi:hypothetical protein B0H66DRAFT_528555 [Apodospora peruviana]|uniref:Uncharacterized protein n=1 Tax=Apodospora peruviana TaxID=516989 RepID=A0AAE0IU04_9PEZI|nr:hypothetical protein B0H66DRAFT_528555 [Apodospora peruviana]